MNENNTHPLTQERAAELWDAHVPLVLNFRVWTWGDRTGILAALRAAYNAGSAEWKANAEAAAERAEHAEDRLADSVHVDEAARRVEAAREQGWDEAAEFLGKIGFHHFIPDLRKAKPCHHVRVLPREDGEFILPADGHEHVEAVVYGHTYYANAAMLVNGNWQAAWGTAIGWAAPISSMTPESITPGTWRAA